MKAAGIAIENYINGYRDRKGINARCVVVAQKSTHKNSAFPAFVTFKIQLVIHDGIRTGKEYEVVPFEVSDTVQSPLGVEVAQEWDNVRRMFMEKLLELVNEKNDFWHDILTGGCAKNQNKK